MGAAAGGAAVGEFIQGLGYFSAGIAAKRTSRFNAAMARINAQAEADALENQALQAEIVAQMADQDAQLARQATAFAVRQQRRIFKQVHGQTRAAIGASGVTMQGTPLDILAEQSYQAGLEIWKTKFEGQLAEREARSRASEARFQAELLRFGGRRVLTVGQMQSSLFKYEGKMAQIASYLQVAGSVVRGVSGGMSGMGGGGGTGGGSGYG
jgi:hypothetical protein